jgi:hypothetical protein
VGSGSFRSLPQLRDLRVEPREVLLPLREIGMVGDELGEDRAAGVERRAGFGGLVRFQMNICELGIRYRDIALPPCVSGIGLGEAVGDGEAVLVGFEVGGEVALVDLDVADLFVGDG